MSHKEEMIRLIEHAGEGHGDQGFGAMQDLLKAQAIAQMLLVEAQEAANEQARWGNIIAWMTANGHEPGPEIAARIIKAIGIEVAE